MNKACEARGCQNEASHSARLINPDNGRINQYSVNMCSEHFERVKADGLLAYVPTSNPPPEQTSEAERRYLEAVNGRAAALRQTSELEAKLRKAQRRISELEKLLAHATAPAIEANTHAMTLDEATARFEAFSAAKRSTARAEELRSSEHDGLEKEEVNMLISHHANRADLLMRYALTGKQ